MPTYHFNAQTGVEVVLDAEGEELPGLEAARRRALADARETLLQAVKFRTQAPDRIQVTDDSGKELLTVALEDILRNP